MTELYFAEKQLRRYPLRSLAYLLVCFVFAVVLVCFGTVAVSMQNTLESLSAEDPMDCVVVSARTEGVTKDALVSEKHVDLVEATYYLESERGRLRADSLGETSTTGYIIFRPFEGGLPERAVSVYEQKYGSSPIICGRAAATEGEVLLNQGLLTTIGVQREDYQKVIGAKLITSYFSFWTKEDADDEEWTVVGVVDTKFDRIVFGTENDYDTNVGCIVYVRALASSPIANYAVYAKRGMLSSVYRTLAEKYGENSVYEERRSSMAKQEFSEYIAFFDRIFLFLLVLLCFSFLGVTVFSVVFYTSKQSEFHMVAAAFGARTRKLIFAQMICYLALLLVAVLFSILAAVLLQGAVFSVLSGYLSVKLTGVSVGVVFAVGGVLFAALALCVSAGVVCGTFAVKKRNL